MIADALVTILLACAVPKGVVTTPPIAPPEVPVEEGRPNRFTVFVTSADEILVGGVRGTLEDVTRAAKQKSTTHKDATMVLRVHKDITVRRVKEVTKAASRGGVNRVIFASSQPNPEEKASKVRRGRSYLLPK